MALLASQEIDLEPPQLEGCESINRPIPTSQSTKQRKVAVTKGKKEPEALPSSVILTNQQKQVKRRRKNSVTPGTCLSQELGTPLIPESSDDRDSVKTIESKPKRTTSKKRIVTKTKAQKIKAQEPGYLPSHSGLHRFHWIEEKTNSYREIFAIVEIQTIESKPMPRNKKRLEISLLYGASIFTRDSKNLSDKTLVVKNTSHKNNVFNYYIERCKPAVKRKHPEWTDSKIQSDLQKRWNDAINEEDFEDKKSLRHVYGEKYLEHLKESGNSKKRKRGSLNTVSQMPNECGHFHTAMSRLLAMPVKTKLDVEFSKAKLDDNETSEIPVQSPRIPYAEFKSKLRKQFHVSGVCDWDTRSVDWERVRNLADSHLPKAKRLRVEE